MAFGEAEYESMEGWESEYESEAARGPKLKKPTTASSFKQRPNPSTPMYVTQPQLEAALGRVDGKIKTVVEGVSTINSRVGALASSVKKEADERKKTADGQGKDLNQKLMMLAILPALVQPSFSIPATAAITLTPDASGNVTVPATTGQTVQANSNTLNLMLPILAITGTGTGTDSGGFDSSTMMMLALAVSLGGNTGH